MRLNTVLSTGLAVGLLACMSEENATEPSTVGSAQLVVAAPYRAVDLGTLGGLNSFAFAINHQGWVVGYSETGAGKFHAFLWKNGIMRDLGTLGGDHSQASAINHKGQVVGWSSTAEGHQHAFLWRNGVMSDLGTLGGNGSRASAINDVGQVVGVSETAKEWPWETRAVLWEKGVISDLLGHESSASDINGAGQVVGQLREVGVNCCRPYLWDNGDVSELESPSGGDAWALNASAQAVGYNWFLQDGDAVEHAAFWDESVTRDLGTLGGPRSLATDVSPTGQVVGFSETAAGMIRAFIWEQDVMTDLGTLGGGNSLAYGINRGGSAVGQSQTPAGDYHATLWTRK